ncbi:hypothetical protein Moror_3195 [Moniliophthora roreri MCA 2997]|uniref:Uncharacterized protein n=1 Tax=Moniliophthora roreri (strain MCA 2997) TaxID=1381753 RepID=V2X7Q9_MONRO|nr:hypothetical protein Moror_3195 [Moniliophthora roreri MCA 2997]
MSTSDPARVQKSRLPKAYTDEQLAFLKSHLPEFERRTQGSVRGDAKKFALEKAGEFIATFGLPNDFDNLEEAEPRFREQIYNWFKNTVGRTRRKLEGRPRSVKKVGEKGTSSNGALITNWSTNLASPPVMPYTSGDPGSSSSSQQQIVSPIQFGGVQPSATILTPVSAGHSQQSSPHQHHSTTSQRQSTHKHSSPQHSSLSLAVNQTITTSSLREAFLQGIDASSLASMIRSFVIANPSQTPLVPVVGALYEAITEELTFNREPHACLRRFLDASTCFPHSIVHAGVSGPLAGPRALQMLIRKNSIWVASSSSSTPLPSNPSSSFSTMTEEMERIAADRQRKKDHIQWARIHAAALESGMMNMVHSGDSESRVSGYAYAMSRAFSEMMARDAVWESDEVEWVAGIYVLRAVIRTAMRGDRRQRDEYDDLLRKYEGRWREIRDETRQALVTDVLLGAKEDLAKLDGLTLQ